MLKLLINKWISSFSEWFEQGFYLDFEGEEFEDELDTSEDSKETNNS